MILWILLAATIGGVFGYPNDTPNSPNTLTAVESMTAMTAQCNITKSCIGVQANCIADHNCAAAATVVFKNNLYEFELRTLAGRYVATAISNDERMGNDSVVACVYDNSTTAGTVNVALSWNVRHSNNPINTSMEENGIALLETSYTDDSIYCKFTRDPITYVQGSAVDLENNAYHLLVASGPNLNADGAIARHSIKFGSTHSQFLHDIGMFDGYLAESAASKLHFFSLLLPCQLIYVLYNYI